MDINIKITLDETPALMNSLNCVCECIRDLVSANTAPSVPASEVKQVTAVESKSTEAAPADPEPKKETPQPPADKLSENELAKLRTCVAAFFHIDKENMKVLKKWLEDHHVTACRVTNIKRDQLPELMAIFPDDVKKLWEDK